MRVWLEMFFTLFFSLFAVGVIVGIIILILILTNNLKIERLDYRPYPIPPDKNPEEVLNSIAERLRRFGYLVERRGNELVISLDSIVHIHLKISSSDAVLEYFVSIESWFLVVMLILLIFLFWVALIIGIVEYIRYDNLKKLVVSSIHTSMSG